MLACIILNYNDAYSVLDLHRKIINYKVLDKIVIVDNKSTDLSLNILRKLQNEKTVVISSDKNGGYGYGNNIGIRYSKKLGADYILIVNPDVEFSEKSIHILLEVLRKTQNCVAVSPRMNDHEPAYRFTTSFGYILSASIVLNKLLRLKYYPHEYFNEPIVKVDVIPGSLVMFDIDKFIECGLYDEKLFLYQEEYVMGKRFAKKEYTSFIISNITYEHYHSVSVKKSFKSAVKIKRVVLKSLKYYLKEYCNMNMAVRVVSFLEPLYCIEIYLWSRIKDLCTKK